MFKKIKNLKVRSKLLCVMLLITIVPQFVAGIIAYKQMKNYANQARSFANSLGQSISSKCQDFYNSSAKDYSLEIAMKHAKEINNTLQKVSEQVESLVLALESIYENESKFSKFLLPLPEMNININKDDRFSAKSSMFAIDVKSSTKDKTLSYNVPEYEKLSANIGKGIYKTNLNDYVSLKDNEAEKILKSNSIVSNNIVPEKILNEMRLLSNVRYLAEPFYITNTDIENICIGTESGIRYSCSCFNNYTRYLPNSRAWYKDAVNVLKNGNNRPVWQSTYKSLSSGKYCVTCSKAFRDSKGNVLGVAEIDIDLSKINESVANTKTSKDGFAFIAGNNGEMISSEDYESENFDKEPLKNPNITESHKKLLNNMMQGETGVSTTNFSYNNKDYLTAYAPIAVSSWSLCIETPISEIEKISKDINNETVNSVTNGINVIEENISSDIKLYLMFFFILICISILLAFALSKLIAGPILNLIDGVKDIGKGNFDEKVAIESKDEIGQLAMAFNKMADDLKSYIEKLKKTTVEKVKLNSELNVAKTIQKDMLPCIFPKFSDQKEYDIFATMHPAKAIGGDFYDFSLIDKDHIFLVIADVSGKSISAALFMVITKTLIKNYACLGFSPEKVFDVVNKQLCENNKAEMFVTSFIATVNLKTGEVKYCNAGHNKPLIYRKSENKFNWLNTSHGFVLAGLDTVKYKVETLTLRPGDALYLYTDGVTEAVNEKKELFSDERLIATLNNNITETSSENALKLIKSKIDDFAGSEPQADDITMLMFKFFGKD